MNSCASSCSDSQSLRPTCLGGERSPGDSIEHSPRRPTAGEGLTEPQDGTAAQARRACGDGFLCCSQPPYGVGSPVLSARTWRWGWQWGWRWGPAQGTRALPRAQLGSAGPEIHLQTRLVSGAALFTPPGHCLLLPFCRPAFPKLKSPSTAREIPK